MKSRLSISVRPITRVMTMGLTALLLTGSLVGIARADKEKAGAVPKVAGKPAAPAPYFLTTDAATGEALPAKPIVAIIKGREFRFATEANRKTFEAAPDKYVGKVDKAMIEILRPLYPTKVCVVSDEELGSMGDPIDMIVGNELIRLCCKSCMTKLENDPAGTMKRVDAAIIKAQKPTYPLKECVVSGEPLGTMGDPVDLVVAGHLVRLCCAGCIDKVNADPSGSVARVMKAGATK